MTQRSVLVVLFDGVQSLDVTGPVEVFAGAGRTAGDPAAYPIRTASLAGGPVRTQSGLRLLPDTTLAEAVAGGAPHTLVVPGGEGTRTPYPALVDWLREHAPRAERLVSVCTGALLLAGAGLLDGHRVTTHWNACGHLARCHPRVDVDPDPIFVRDGRLSTSAGVTAGIDLALALVEEDLGRVRKVPSGRRRPARTLAALSSVAMARHDSLLRLAIARTGHRRPCPDGQTTLLSGHGPGRDVALTVARHLVVFLRRPGNQAQFSVQLSAQTARREPLRDLQQWIAEHPDGDLSVEALAARVRLSPRHFARAFQAETGTPPGRYVDLVRLEHARRLLEETRSGVEEVARASGYGTPEAMRRAFLKALGTPPAEYRSRFHIPVA